MFSLRIHKANVPGHTMIECREYTVVPHGSGNKIEMVKPDGTPGEIIVEGGGLVFVMGDSGKTVEVIRSRPPAQMRAGVERVS